jgi:DNA-binding transcriptional ArsR family regulator
VQIGSSTRSSLETPLNWILSNESSVRILRELFLSGSPLSKSEIAHRAGISLAGVVKALPRLFDTGLVMPVGTGTRQAVALRDAHPLKGTLGILYTTEALQKQQLTTELTQLISRSPLEITSAWLDEATRTGPSAPVTIGVLTSSAEVRAVQDSLRPDIAQLAGTFGVTLELTVRTVPDILALSPDERERLGDVTPLYGPDP